MPSAIKEATSIQIGKEAARGTLVAAARRLVSPSATHRILEEQVEFEEQMDGLLTRAAYGPLVTRHSTQFEIPLTLDFEQILLPLLSGVKGGVAPTSPGTDAARLWTFKPSVSGDPAPDAYTVEWITSDFITNNEWEAGYALTENFEISSSDSGAPEASISMFARRSKRSTMTAGVALPTLTHAVIPRWHAYADNSWAALGTTQIVGQIYGLTVTWTTGIRPAYYLDGRADLDFSKYEFSKRMVDVTLEVIHGAAATDFVEAEQVHKDSQAKRFLQLQLNGPAFADPDGALNRFIRLKGCFVHAPDSMDSRGSDRDGSVSTTVHLRSYYDSTAAQDVEMAVQNNLATFP